MFMGDVPGWPVKLTEPVFADESLAAAAAAAPAAAAPSLASSSAAYMHGPINKDTAEGAACGRILPFIAASLIEVLFWRV